MRKAQSASPFHQTLSLLSCTFPLRPAALRRIADVIRIPPQRGGWLEVICGPMFSGKSEEMIRRLRRAEIAGQRVVIFKPLIDDRFDASDVVSHAGLRMPAVPVVVGRGARRPRPRIRGRRHRRGAVLRAYGRPRGAPAGGRRRTGRRRRARPGLPAPAVRADARAPLARGVRRQAPGRLPPLRRPGDDHATPRGRTPGALLGRDGRRRRSRAVRGALPRLPRAGCRRARSSQRPRSASAAAARAKPPAATSTIVPPGGRSA